MKAFLHHYRFFFGGLIVFSIITISLFYSALKPAKTLPIYNPADVNPELVDSTIQYKSKYHTIADFSFVNQNGKTITQKDYEGKIYVADFFFTTCGSICPKMTTNLEDVQKAIRNNPKVMLLSHTVFPETDRNWAQVSEDPEPVLDALYKYDSGGARYLTNVAQRLLERAALNDEKIDSIYRIEMIP
jgi:cytochrome oxidase Cu insertion factor (SCO1/SenC/PrrC family)